MRPVLSAGSEVMSDRHQSWTQVISLQKKIVTFSFSLFFFSPGAGDLFSGIYPCGSPLIKVIFPTSVLPVSLIKRNNLEKVTTQTF